MIEDTPFRLGGCVLFKFFLEICRGRKIPGVYSIGKGESVIDIERIIERIRSGDRQAFREIVELYSKHVFHVAYSVLHDSKEAEDAAQEAFVQVYKSLPQYRNEGFKTWLSRIALHKALDIKRKQDRRPAELIDVAQSLVQLPSPDEDVLARLIREEQTVELSQKIAQLPQQHRDIIQAYYMQGKTYDQIAEETQVALKTVESRLYRARLWIRNHWKEEEWH
ncbi:MULTISPECIES: RNA polymerase sigma factor [Paenibacillus]|uniref:RNA polymerase sigma factor n=1 Tax=Paenibacillus TaxID=44249 RepID=UPI0005CEF4A3|nr:MULTISPECIES: RNA polymerase sigma factor [Paenibacillus]KAF6584352.1 RNA polymerase sigma factor [Paenibacillus sp. EKM211P]KJD41649.1 DNA-directed RNA polymerase subunit sigma [Paenibacillus polymyxa]